MAKNAQGCPFSRILERRYEAKQREYRTQQPDACIEGKDGKRNRAATGNFEDGAGTAPFLPRQHGTPRHVPRLFRNLKAIECRPTSSGLLDTADITRELQQSSGAFSLQSFSSGARGHGRLR